MAISKEKFGNTLRAIREQTTKESANHISLELLFGGGYISDVENGKHYPSMDKFMKLMDYYDTPYSIAFGENSNYSARISAYMGRIMNLDEDSLELVCDTLDGMLKNLEKNK